MNKCVNCDYTTENDEKFCPNCGGELIVEAVAEVVAPAPAPKGNVTGIVGLIASIAGMLFALPCIGCCFIPVYGIPGLIVNGIMCAFFSTVGLICSWKNNKIGKILAIIALIIVVAAIILGIITFGGLLVVGLLAGLIGGIVNA